MDISHLQNACAEHGSVIVRMVVGIASPDVEAAVGLTRAALMAAVRRSPAAWDIVRSVTDAGHSRGNPLPAQACIQLGLPPVA